MHSSNWQIFFSRKRKIAGYSIIFLFIALLASLFKTFILEVYCVTSISMMPTLLQGDYILVAKYSYRIKTPEYLPYTDIKIPAYSFSGAKPVRRGDLVVFEPPLFINGKKILSRNAYVKRCFGLPGDQIDLYGARLLINKKEIKLTSYTNISGKPDTARLYVTIPAKGDSIDSYKIRTRFYQDLIKGEDHKVDLRNDNRILIDGKMASYYVVEKNYYFLIGDNSNRSTDSRIWGFLPESNLIGQAIMIAFSWAEDECSWSKTIRWTRIGKTL
ncbi:MAG TPA: signal peptidase I [Ignavibacteriales bacterium]|nr:signal peptidase I [Ignavibacteriales bacterium]